MTLSMWVVSEEEVDPEIAVAVTEEINSMTRSKYKTELVITYLTEDQYYEKLTAEIEAYAAAEAERKEQQEAEEESKEDETGTGEETTTAPEVETYIDDNGLLQEKYPALEEHQVDIIYIGNLVDGDGNLIVSGQDMYSEFVTKGWLAELDSELKNSSKKIAEYISPTLLSSVKQDGVTYAIPNNNVIGEYKYMLLNQKLMDRYALQGYFQRGLIDGFYNEYIYQFLNLVALNEDLTKVIPVDATYDQCLELLAHYWTIDEDDYTLDSDQFSIFGTLYEDLQSLSRGETVLGVQSLLENEDFVAAFLQLNKYRLDKEVSYFKQSEDQDTSAMSAAVKFVNGDLTVLDAEGYYRDKNGERYYVVPVAYPTATAEDIYGNMFAVSSYSVSVSRSMEIITCLNTNTEMRNLLQYGVEGENYRLDDNGRVVRLSNKNNKQYVMDIYATGNAFLAYLEPQMDESIWENGKVQNRSSLVEPLLGFDLDSFALALSPEDTTITIDEIKGYNLSYSSGYSKDLLSQNEKLKTWIEQCDAAGKGVYIYKSVDDGKKQYVANYYLYNNTGSANFTVVEEPITTVEVNDAGIEVEKQVGVTLVLNYSDVQSSGYELSLVSFARPADYQSKIVCKVNDTETAMVETAQTDVLNFDFYNTDEFTVEIYDDLTIPHIIDNPYLNEVITAWYKDTNMQTTNNVLIWSDTTSSETENYYTYVVYRKNMKYITDLQVLPKGNSGELVLHFDFNGAETTDNSLDVTTQRNYLLYYVRVTTDKDVSFSHKITLNGGDDSATFNPMSATKDPDFVMIGNLDTELVKYMAELNEDILGLIYACEDYASLEKTITTLSYLLNTKTKVSENELKSTYGTGSDAFLKKIKDTVIGSDWTALFDKLRHITHAETMDVLTDTVKTWANGDEYVYYTSPYGIYYAWLETYSYLPAN
ncbi:MAG: hypothetical protein IJW92_00210 [Clostridia bacterium]|nr:hypothetical protein [Clostridia bacterium]